MQGNTTEIDERNLLRLDALLSHGYGLSPQLVMRSKGLSIEAKALYGYLSSFAGAGDTAFPSTSRILEELDISKNRFYKIRKELVSWGFISIETTATSAGLRTVYTLPQNPIAIKTEIDEIANRRNEIKSSLVANLHNEDMVSHKRDSESECLQQSAGNEPCRQSEAKAQNRGSNLKPCLQSEDEGCLQSGDKLYIDTNINPKVSIDRSAAHPSDDEGPSDWKVTEGMTDPTQRDDGESDRGATGRNALDAVPDGTYDPLPTVADGYTLSNSEFEAFNRLCSLSIKTVRGAVRNEAAKQYANSNTGHRYQPLSMATERLGYNWTSALHGSLPDTLACLAAQKCVDDHNWCVENLELTEDAIMNAKPIENGSEGLPKDCWDLNPGGRPFAVTEPILHRLQSSAKLCARAGITTQFTRMTVNQWFDKAERSQRSPLGRSVDIGRAASALNSQHEHAEVPQDLIK